MISRRALLPVILLVLTASRGVCGDFTMGRYDPSQTSFCPETLPMPIALDWELTTTRFTANAASPVIAGKTCYFACGDHVYAVDMETGLTKWKYPSEQGLGGSVKVTPAVYNGMLYFGDTLGNLYCISTDTGTFQWAYQTRSAIRCPPVIDDGVIYIGSDDKSVYAIDATTGESATGWAKPFVARDDFAVGLAVSNGIVVASCMDGNLYGIHEGSGKLKWGPVRLPEAPVDTSPVVEQNVVVMVVGNTMYGLNIRGGQTQVGADHTRRGRGDACRVRIGRLCAVQGQETLRIYRYVQAACYEVDGGGGRRRHAYFHPGNCRRRGFCYRLQGDDPRLFGSRWRSQVAVRSVPLPTNAAGRRLRKHDMLRLPSVTDGCCC